MVWLLGLLMGAGLGNEANAADRLQPATSPHLARQADSPVAWQPWGEEALSQAKREQKLVFLSIGYAACRWCRLMDRESFRDPATVSLLNAHFVSIRVDRDERPDLDSHFMHILTAMTGQGGWPLNMILTPALQPVYGGGYFAPETGRGQPSLKAVLSTVLNQWRDDRGALLTRLGKMTTWLAEPRDLPPPSPDGADPRPGAVAFWQARFDDQYGGIAGRESKSPQPLILSLLLRQAALGRQPAEARLALLTLDQMAAGGVRDQLGGAFHRLATDARWQVPHFEIMLHDNALLVRAYLEAWQLTGQARYALVVREVLDDLLQRLRLPGGCFAATLAADDGDGEGKYYTWDAAEITRVLGAQDAAPFLELFFDPVEGVVAGRSVLRLLGGLETLAQSRRESQQGRQRLLAAREQRPPPARDDKILTSWNGLMLSALARAGAVLQEPRYLAAARDCLADLNRVFPTPGQLRHSRRGEQVGAEVFLDDYAFLAQALLDLYEADFELPHLAQAHALGHAMLDHFQPAAGQLLLLTPREQVSAIPARTVLEDGATPAGHSVALITLQRLLLFSQEGRLEKETEAMRQRLSGYLAKQASGAPELLHLLDYRPDSAVEVIVAGPRAHPDTRALLAEVRRRLIPGLVLALVEPGQAVDGQTWPLLAGRPMLEGKPTAYVCRNLVCRLPVSRVADLARELEGGNGASQ
ncbi:MAG: thioredoxin domain-containing protein [Magnetococcus sp. DMHC-8]